TELLTADYTFANERLARFYGISGVYGSHFRRVQLKDPNRAGLLGQASILTVTSYSTRTSPVVRGKYLLSNILGSPPPPPTPAEFRQALLGHRSEFIETVAEKLLTYALGRGVEYYDMPAVRAIVKETAQNDYRWSGLILGIVKSGPFQMRSPVSADQPGAKK